CEYIAFGASVAGSERLLGEQLAAMHRHTADRFGWHRDNTIGSTVQQNTRQDDWLEFWSRHRLGFQMEQLSRRGMGCGLAAAVASLCEALPAFFSGYTPEPSLLHGDLWGGNRGFDENGAPVIFDPAVYYGDREADIAMTELFGGFGPDFYAAYQAAWPLDAGYQQRKTLYNLYHIMNHANLFGGGYLHQAESMASELLAGLG
ncbi:MAG: fructosamine kinase family protein, partial [Mariprofundaceae bacterium]